MPQELYRLSANGWDRKHWKRVALITHERHIEDLKARGEIHDVLVISSDWLLWQQCANQKIACMSIEAALISNPIDAYWRRQLLVQGNSWVYDGDDDMTLFQGASVGKLFNTEMTIALSAYLRISTALRTIIQDHKIEELIYYDVRAETNLINNDLRFQIARDVATQDKISCIDRMDALEPDDPAQPMVPEGAGPHHSIMRRVATRVATMLMAVTTNLLTFRNRRRRGALIAVQQPIMIPLLLRNSRAKLYPLFWPEWMPKKPAFMNIYRKCGARFMSLANLKLSGREIERFESLIGGLTKDWDTGLTTPHGFIRHLSLIHI